MFSHCLVCCWSSKLRIANFEGTGFLRDEKVVHQLIHLLIDDFTTSSRLVHLHIIIITYIQFTNLITLLILEKLLTLPPQSTRCSFARLAHFQLLLILRQSSTYSQHIISHHHGAHGSEVFLLFAAHCKQAIFSLEVCRKTDPQPRICTCGFRCSHFLASPSAFRESHYEHRS